MPVCGLFHIAIKTNDLAATLRFYKDVIGLTEVTRPPFGFPGAWLACPVPGGDAVVVHIYAGGPALGKEGRAPDGSAAIDHVSLAAIGYHDYIQRFREDGLDWREFAVPETTLWQLFVYDPSGVQLELTFNGAAEMGPAPDMSEGRRYVAGTTFFPRRAARELYELPCCLTRRISSIADTEIPIRCHPAGDGRRASR